MFSLTSAHGLAGDEIGYTFSYYTGGRICVDQVGKMDGKRPIIVPTGEAWDVEDFKPSWSKTGDWLVFFRRVRNDPVVTEWKTVLYVGKSDGSNLRKMTDDRHTNFNPTWTRDETRAPLWNRKHPAGHFLVMRSKIDNLPEQADILSNRNHHTWEHSTLSDGRLLVEAVPSTMGFGYYLIFVPTSLSHKTRPDIFSTTLIDTKNSAKGSVFFLFGRIAGFLF